MAKVKLVLSSEAVARLLNLPDGALADWSAEQLSELPQFTYGPGTMQLLFATDADLLAFKLRWL